MKEFFLFMKGKDSALTVETAGYAVLAMMAWDARAYDQQARKVIKWITSQRNWQGGFYLSQVSVTDK